MQTENTIIIGNYRYYLRDNSLRQGMHPDANFRGTGMALYKVEKINKKKSF